MNKRHIWIMLLCCLLPIIGLVPGVLAFAGILLSPAVGAVLMSLSTMPDGHVARKTDHGVNKRERRKENEKQ